MIMEVEKYGKVVQSFYRGRSMVPREKFLPLFFATCPAGKRTGVKGNGEYLFFCNWNWSQNKRVGFKYRAR